MRNRRRNSVRYTILYVGLNFRKTSVDAGSSPSGFRLGAIVTSGRVVGDRLCGRLDGTQGCGRFGLPAAGLERMLLLVLQVVGVAGSACCPNCEQAMLSRAPTRELTRTCFSAPSRSFALFVRRMSVVWNRKNQAVCDRRFGYFDGSVSYSGFLMGDQPPTFAKWSREWSPSARGAHLLRGGISVQCEQVCSIFRKKLVWSKKLTELSSARSLNLTSAGPNTRRASPVVT